MTDLSVNKKAIEAATAVEAANANSIAAQASRAEASALFFAPAAKLGADFTMLAKPTGDDAKNNSGLPRGNGLTMCAQQCWPVKPV